MIEPNDPEHNQKIFDSIFGKCQDCGRYHERHFEMPSASTSIDYIPFLLNQNSFKGKVRKASLHLLVSTSPINYSIDNTKKNTQTGRFRN